MLLHSPTLQDPRRPERPRHPGPLSAALEPLFLPDDKRTDIRATRTAKLGSWPVTHPGAHSSLAHGLNHHLRPILLNEMVGALDDLQLALWRERRRLRLNLLPQRFPLRRDGVLGRHKHNERHGWKRWARQHRQGAWRQTGLLYRLDGS